MLFRKLSMALVIISSMLFSSAIFAMNIYIELGVTKASNNVYVDRQKVPLNVNKGEYPVNWGEGKVLCIYNAAAKASFSYVYNPAVKYPSIVQYQSSKGWAPLKYEGNNKTLTPTRELGNQCEG